MKFRKQILQIIFVIGVCFLSMLFLGLKLSYAEDIQITTYYPAPFGVYNEMNVGDRMAIGDVDGNGTIDAGDLGVDSGGNPLSGSLVIAGQLGIGTNVITDTMGMLTLRDPDPAHQGNRIKMVAYDWLHNVGIEIDNRETPGAGSLGNSSYIDFHAASKGQDYDGRVWYMDDNATHEGLGLCGHYEAAFAPDLFVDASGAVGINNPAPDPNMNLQIMSNNGNFISLGNMGSSTGLLISPNKDLSGNSAGYWYDTGSQQFSISARGRINIDSSNGQDLVLQNFANGSVGIRTVPNASYALDVHGTIHADGADLAENFYVEEDVEIGDVVVIGDNESQKLKKSLQAYSLRVAGVISTDPGLAIGDKKEGQLPLGLVGQVPCKVTDQNGPIKKGDLLVSSSKPGYAMRAQFIPLQGIDNFLELTKALEKNARRRQAVIGKALESSDKEGKILILLNK